MQTKSRGCKKPRRATTLRRRVTKDTKETKDTKTESEVNLCVLRTLGVLVLFQFLGVLVLTQCTEPLGSSVGGSSSGSSSSTGSSSSLGVRSVRIGVSRPSASAISSTFGRSVRSFRPKRIRNSLVVAYRNGRPTTCFRPTILIRWRSSSVFSTPDVLTPRDRKSVV